MAPWARAGDSFFLRTIDHTRNYATGGDAAILREISAELRVRSPRGEIAEIQIADFDTLGSPTLTRLEVSAESIPFDGEIVGLEVRRRTSSRRDVYAVASVGRDRGRLYPIASGYPGVERPLSLGELVPPGPVAGHGNILSIDLTDVAAGSDYTTQVVPTNTIWVVTGYAGTLVTDVTAINREVTIDILDDAGAVVGGWGSGVSQAASTTGYYRLGSPAGLGTASAGVDRVAFGTIDIRMLAGFQIDFRTINLQAGDNWGDGQLLVEEWLIPP